MNALLTFSTVALMAVSTVISFYAGGQFSIQDLSFVESNGQGISMVGDDELADIKTNPCIAEIEAPCAAAGGNTEHLEALMANPSSRPAATQWYAANLGAEEVSTAGDNTERLDALMANPGSRQAAIQLYALNLGAEETSTAADDNAKQLDTLLANPGSRSAAIELYVSNLGAEEASTAAGDNANLLDTLLANPGTRPAAIQ